MSEPKTVQARGGRFPPGFSVAAAFVAAVLVPATGAYLAHVGASLLYRLDVDVAFLPTWPIGGGGFLGPMCWAAWVMGALPLALALAYRLLWRRRSSLPRWLRMAVGVLGVAALVLTGFAAIAPRQLPGGTIRSLVLDPLCAAIGGLTAVAVAVGTVRPVALDHRWLRGALTLASLAAVLALSTPTLVEAWREYQPQRLARFRMELVAAYPYEPERTGAVVIDKTGSPGEVVEWRGERFNLHHSNHLVIESTDVKRVRWIASGTRASLAIRLGAKVQARLETRSSSRMSQFDAWFIDRTLVAVALYQDVMLDRLWLSDPDPSRLRSIYRALVGRDP